jgi:hypothetical protein
MQLNQALSTIAVPLRGANRAPIFPHACAHTHTHTHTRARTLNTCSHMVPKPQLRAQFPDLFARTPELAVPPKHALAALGGPAQHKELQDRCMSGGGGVRCRLLRR